MGKRDQDRGTIDRLPSGALRVRVFAGRDPITGRRHSRAVELTHTSNLLDPLDHHAGQMRKQHVQTMIITLRR